MFRIIKRYGQHYLTDKSIAFQTANSLPINSCKNVLEVGPGFGALTKHLYEQPINLTVVEIDKKSLEALKIHVPSYTLNIIHEDFLKLNLYEIFNQKEFSVIGNFPYNISSQILFRVLEHHRLIPNLVGMFQKEVAQRITSGPGSKEYGILSVMTQLYYHPELLFDVPSNVFYPQPKVESSVIRLTRLDDDQYPCRMDLLYKIIKSSFNHRRKQLRSSLKKFMFPEFMLDDEVFSKRPEQLTALEFVEITKQLEYENFSSYR
ncbi:MAG: 16S rRNA (adenine(1518)-N(6)/adenine(1519)-N(6))-dimethyltransferase RsmA [Flavobacteriaceae bacterium]|nr:16S rRNA (adenine(1518)-N(6)/adenine(1519)-N(6))-dimethyltransferase RsmA [Flavobacteriaceae bacterium]MCY4267486.1 16S rRNA (adenine(1518)-N(6)/adenine(1519)-N(6))-dimethyltransferase RsmA [Flavobacteriaceae bacterium]MCY4298290.1 16S rRNA (adenine(1518)-N(6)/adenine(1519)-N(6))-dimethyltransferase RsmA [Flavobacteriaceae bacterium]